MAEVNLCPNPACAIDTTGWSFYSDYPGTLSAAQVDGMARPTAGQVTQNNEDNPSNGTARISPPRHPVTAGQRYQVLVQVRVTAIASSTFNSINLSFADSSLSFLTAVRTRLDLTPGVSRWVLLEAVAPAGAATFGVEMSVSSFGGQSVLAMTGVRYRIGQDPTLSFADGDTPGWSWTGASGLSASLDSPSAAWVAAVEGGDRRPLVSARADWLGNGYDHPLAELDDVVSSLSTDRSIASSLPAEVGLVEGATSARASISLSGRWRETLNLDPDSPNVADRVSPSDALAPYRPDAPLFGAPVVGVPFVADTGILSSDGRKVSRRFTGSVSGLSLQASEQSAEVDLLDGANRLRAPIDLPAHAADSTLVRKFGQQGYSHRINSHFLIDYALRRNGIYASPPSHPQAIISATMHGSTIPEVGYGGLTRPTAASLPGTSAWTYGGHPFGVMYPNRAIGRLSGAWTRDIPTPTRNGTGIGFALRVYVNPAQAGTSASMIRVRSDGGVYVYCYMQDGRPVVGVGGAVGGTAIFTSNFGVPTTAAWLMVGGHISFTATTARIFAWFNGGQSTTTYTLPAGFRSSEARTNTAVEFDTDIPFTDFSTWQSSVPPSGEWPGETHVPQARLDQGRNELLGVPALSGEDSWALLKEITTAEFGTCGFDEDGLFEFRARATGLDGVAPRVVSSDRELSNLVVKIDEAAVRNVITASAAPYLIDDYEDVFQSTAVDQLDCGPGITTFNFPIDPNVTEVGGAGSFWVFNTDYSTSAAGYKYRDTARVAVVRSADPKTVYDPVPGQTVLFQYTVIMPGVLQIVVTNNSGLSLRFATKSDVDGNGNITSDGEPAFRLGGRVVREQSEQTVSVWDDGSIVTYGERAYDLGGKSRFRQHLDSVSGIASAVLASTAQPAPVLDAITVPHDPRRKLRDRVRIVDRTGQGEIVGTIVGIKSTFDTKATDVLTVRPIGPPGLGILDDPSLGLVGSTLVFGA